MSQRSDEVALALLHRWEAVDPYLTYFDLQDLSETLDAFAAAEIVRLKNHGEEAL